MPRKPTGDATLEAEIERAMRPYRNLLPPEMQEVFENLIVMAFTEHPVGRIHLERLRPPPVTGRSGPRAILNDTAAPEDRPSLHDRARSGEAPPDHAGAGGVRGAARSRRKPGGRGGGR
jgi:hypothetical protein